MRPPSQNMAQPMMNWTGTIQLLRLPTRAENHASTTGDQSSLSE